MDMSILNGFSDVVGESINSKKIDCLSLKFSSIIPVQSYVVCFEWEKFETREWSHNVLAKWLFEEKGYALKTAFNKELDMYYVKVGLVGESKFTLDHLEESHCLNYVDHAGNGTTELFFKHDDFVLSHCMKCSEDKIFSTEEIRVYDTLHHDKRWIEAQLEQWIVSKIKKSIQEAVCEAKSNWVSSDPDVSKRVKFLLESALNSF